MRCMNKTTVWAIAAMIWAVPSICAANPESTEISAPVSDSPQVCQFSLSSYSGTVSYLGNTETFTVGLSCPQESDVYATVVVFINQQHAASEVVKVAAGKTRSESTRIAVGGKYAGQSYTLAVQ